jgi:hypothetical protein
MHDARGVGNLRFAPHKGVQAIYHLRLKIFIVLSLILTGCSGNEPGASIPPRTENILIAGVAGRSATLNFDIPGGELVLKGLAASQNSVSGTVEYNSEALKPLIEENTKTYQLSQKPKDQKLPGLLINKWNLQVGKESPLEVNAQIGNGNFNFAVGDLKLSKLTAKIGNGDTAVTFDQPSSELSLIDLNVNNGKINLSGLPNAAPESFNLKVGSGEIKLDLTGGQLRRSLAGSLGIGNGNVVLSVPAGVGVRLECTITTGNCNAPGFKRVANSNYFENEFFAKGGTTTIVIRVGVSNGNLEVTTK